MTITVFDELCGFGGSSQGIDAIPGVEVIAAANHSKLALHVHGLNFPNAIHLGGDIAKRRAKTFPRADIFWASPACPPWSSARGKRMDFDKSTVDQGTLWADDETDGQRRERLELAQRRALMEEVPKYLRRMSLRGKPVLAGVVENVIEARKWAEWDRWIREIETSDPGGYVVKVIALNSMHARGVRTRQAPQSRDRLYVAYVHRSLGRVPDWDKWLRPQAWCPTCDEMVAAVQSWKRPGADMGRYGTRFQYVYRCPSATCRNRQVEPLYVPAASAIDWTIPGQRIGDKELKEFFDDKAKTKSLGFHPLSPKTLARIEAGIRRYARPVTVPAGGTWRDGAVDLHHPLPARTTRENDGVLVPPLLVPVEGRQGKQATPSGAALRTQTARNETGFLIPPLVMRPYTPRGEAGVGGQMLTPIEEHLRSVTASSSQSIVVPPFIAELRGGSSDARPLSDALATVTASGNHHGLVLSPAQTMAAWAAVYAYDAGALRNHRREPLPTQTTVEGDAILSGQITGDMLPEVEDCLFRMLEPHEIAAAMAFAHDYLVTGTRRQLVQGYGNAVTPPTAEVLVSALVECITGEPLLRAWDLAA